MLVSAAVVLSLTVALGLVLLVFRLQDKPLSTAIVTAHGILAMMGLFLLALIGIEGMEVFMGLPTNLMEVLRSPFSPTRWVFYCASLFFVLTIALGFVLLSFSVRKKSLPIKMVVFHGLAGGIALLVLIGLVFALENELFYILQNAGVESNL